jgi:ribosomal protein S18 acetylase RimI-like enzyme
MGNAAELRIRPVRADDADFVLALVPRFVAFALPPWRERAETAAGIRRKFEQQLAKCPDASHLFVAETVDGDRAGFLHLQATIDFFTEAANCHISDLAVADGMDGRGVGGALLDFAERWAKAHRCRFITLSAFPGNVRAIALYERHGYATELFRMAKSIG